MSYINEKQARVKYIRALERFGKSAIVILKRDDFDKELFRDRVSKNLEILHKVEPVFLDSSYAKELENFAKSVANLEDKEILIKQANQLDKLKNRNSYKKDKHKGSKFSGEF
ncbi:MAG: hypothetical protein GXZ15_05295 [Campylobacter sp.]|nr:hypothetical protein [Campylobacter sp.]